MAESARKFHERHGGDAKCVQDREWRYYPDGALLENSVFGHGARFEPPEDEVQLAKNITRYYELKLSQTEREFQVLQREMSIQCSVAEVDSGFPLPEFEPLEQLQKQVLFLRKRVAKCQKKLEAIDPDARFKRNSELIARQTQLEAKAAQVRLSKIRI